MSLISLPPPSIDVVFPDFVSGSLSSTAAATVGCVSPLNRLLCQIYGFGGRISITALGDDDGRTAAPTGMAPFGASSNTPDNDTGPQEPLRRRHIYADNEISLCGPSLGAFFGFLSSWIRDMRERLPAVLATFCSPAHQRRRTSLQDGAATLREDGDGLQEAVLAPAPSRGFCRVVPRTRPALEALGPDALVCQLSELWRQCRLSFRTTFFHPATPVSITAVNSRHQCPDLGEPSWMAQTTPKPEQQQKVTHLPDIGQWFNDNDSPDERAVISPDSDSFVLPQDSPPPTINHPDMPHPPSLRQSHGTLVYVDV
ncbi:hypothetical protein BDZ89DRAFT_1142469 [Hymenopellis radicata]|nr:hypothetical protein BDZ89DRAFT_1142469 [Hymenopellis radicata]